MIKVMRSLDAIGSLILDFAQTQKIVGVWATFMDPFDLQFGQSATSYGFDLTPVVSPFEKDPKKQR